MSVFPSTTILPPNVNGKIRGHFDINIISINWQRNQKQSKQHKSVILKRTENSTNNNYSNLFNFFVKIIWWGENHNLAQQQEFTNSSLNFSYDIQTSGYLFQKYLRSCDPIEIKFTSKISNLQIGTAYCRIPSKFLRNPVNQLSHSGEVKESVNLQIYKVRNQIIGNLELQLKMQIFDMPTVLDNQQPSEITTKRSDVSENLMEKKCEFDRCSPLQIKRIYKSDESKRDSNHSHSYRDTLSSRALDYLTGSKMSVEEEELALNEIHRTSPLDNFCDHDLLASLKLPMHSSRLSNNNWIGLLERINMIRLKVFHLILLPPGIRDVYVDSLMNTVFTIECRISPSLLDQIRFHMNFDVIRFYSNGYDDNAQKIDFNKDAIRPIRITCNDLNPSLVEHSEFLFTIWWRKFGSKKSRCFGSAKYRFTNLLNSHKLEKTKKLPIKSFIGDVHVGDLICNFTFGSRDGYFSSDLINSCSRHIAEQDFPTCRLIFDKNVHRNILTERNYVEKYKTTPKDTNGLGESNASITTIKSQETKKSQQSTQTTSDLMNMNCNEKDSNEIKTTKQEESEDFCQLYGLLFVGSIRNCTKIEKCESFLICQTFWKDDVISSNSVENNEFNLIETFPVINNEKFLSRTRDNHLVLEVWKKNPDKSEILIGSVKLPLHQFFIAFRDKTLTNHLSKAIYPVISIDGWSAIVCSINDTNCGELQTLLAIGTKEQLERLQIQRGISLDANSIRIPLPSKLVSSEKSKCREQESQTNIRDVLTKATTTEDLHNKVERREKLSDLLGNFLENLQQQSHTDQNSLSNSQKTVVDQKQPIVRRTSDLLNVLQKALGAPQHSLVENQITDLKSAINNSKTCKILLGIESALHLPRSSLKLCNKKSQKRKDKTNVSGPQHEDPSAYVTFQAEEGNGDMIKSHEGMVYYTNVIEKSSNPTWNRDFNITVPTDFLLNDEKRFILKIWKKAGPNLTQTISLPAPMEDSIIGFAAIDLTVLMAKLPCISGWFNIVDFNGRINGQIKINVKPLEDVSKFINHPTCSSSNYGKPGQKTGNLASHNLELNCSNSNDGISDLTNTTLSRAIKRKFTELEEITQRLRARLLDVTGEDDNIDDAQLDEFEHDLNTACTDDECFSNGQECNFKSDGYTPLTTNRTIDIESVSSTTSSQERVRLISEYLKRTDIDELSLMKNNEKSAKNEQSTKKND